MSHGICVHAGSAEGEETSSRSRTVLRLPLPDGDSAAMRNERKSTFVTALLAGFPGDGLSRRKQLVLEAQSSNDDTMLAFAGLMLTDSMRATNLSRAGQRAPARIRMKQGISKSGTVQRMLSTCIHTAWVHAGSMVHAVLIHLGSMHLGSTTALNQHAA